MSKKFQIELMTPKKEEKILYRPHFNPEDDSFFELNKKLNSIFTDYKKEYLKQEDINNMADHVVRYLQTTLAHNSGQPPAYTIMEVLTPNGIFSHIHDSADNGDWGYDYISRELSWKDPSGNIQRERVGHDELEYFLSPIREEVLAQLSKVIDPNTVYLVKKALSRKGRTVIAELHGDKITKDLGEDMYSVDETTFAEALDTLHAGPERSPYIAYPQTKVTKSKIDNAHTHIMNKLDIVTLDELMRNDNISIETALKYVTDAMKGELFLLEKGLILTDIKPSNIWVDGESKLGKLFDFDGLTKNNSYINRYIAGNGSKLPEWNHKDDSKEFIINEPQIVYEFGTTLQVICDFYSNTYNMSINQQLIVLKDAAISPNIQDRPTLKQMIMQIEQLKNL